MTSDPGSRRPRRWFPSEPTRPLAVEGGLKARSTRGAIGQTWWSGRFIAVLEAIIVGGRLERGRNYARRGQVLSMDVTVGMVSALVQGSRVQPFRRSGSAARPPHVPPSYSRRTSPAALRQ